MAHPHAVFDMPVTEVYSWEKYPLGTLRLEYDTDTETKAYRFCKAVDSASFTAIAAKIVVNASAGCPAMATAVAWNVTCDVAGGSALAISAPIGQTAGPATAALPYCWVQTRGYAIAVAGENVTVANGYIKPDDDEDGEVMNATEADMSYVYAIATANITAEAAGTIFLITPM